MEKWIHFAQVTSLLPESSFLSGRAGPGLRGYWSAAVTVHTTAVPSYPGPWEPRRGRTTRSHGNGERVRSFSVLLLGLQKGPQNDGEAVTPPEGVGRQDKAGGWHHSQNQSSKITINLNLTGVRRESVCVMAGKREYNGLNHSQDGVGNPRPDVEKSDYRVITGTTELSINNRSLYQFPFLLSPPPILSPSLPRLIFLCFSKISFSNACVNSMSVLRYLTVFLTRSGFRICPFLAFRNHSEMSNQARLFEDTSTAHAAGQVWFTTGLP